MIERAEPISKAEIEHIEIDQVEENNDEYCEIINPELFQDKRNQLRDLLKEFSYFFVIGPKLPSATNRTEHIIDTGDARPVKRRQHRLAPTVEAEINRQVTEMLANGLCGRSDSPWSRRVISVTEKDKGMRFIVDYRDLNDVTRKNAYPMPSPSDILDRMHGHQYFTLLDGASAYWSVKIREEDK